MLMVIVFLMLIVMLVLLLMLELIAVLIVVLIVVLRVVLYESYAVYLSAVLEYLSTDILGKPCWLSLPSCPLISSHYYRIRSELYHNFSL